MSVQVTNQISEYTLSGLIGAGRGALASYMSAATPMVDPAKGALYGAIGVLANRLITVVGTKLFHLENPMASSASKVLVAALAILGSIAASWFAISLTGVALTLNQLVSFELLNIICSIPIAFIRSALNPQPA